MVRVKHLDRASIRSKFERSVPRPCPLEPDEMAVVDILKISVAYTTVRISGENDSSG